MTRNLCLAACVLGLLHCFQETAEASPGASRPASSPAGRSQPPVRTSKHIERISGTAAEFTITVNGTADHRRMGGWKEEGTSEHNPTCSLRIANQGNRPVVNPRVVVEGGPDWFDTDRIIGQFARPDMSDQEKTFALWQWVRRNMRAGPTFEGSLWGDGKSMSRFMNALGTGACGTYHQVMPVIGKQAGLDTYSGCLADCSHAVQKEVYDGQDRYFDAHIEHQTGQPQGWFALKLDNAQIAGIDDIMNDRYLIDRAGGGPDRFSYVAYFGPGCSFHRVGERRDPRNMGITLRPGEAMTWHWDLKAPTWKPGTETRETGLHCTGTVEYAPRLTRADVERDAVLARGIRFAALSDGAPVLLAEQGDAELAYRMYCPYPITRAAIAGQIEGPVAISFSFDGQRYEPVEPPASQASGARAMDVTLPDGPRFHEPNLTHEVWFRLALRDDRARLQGLRLRVDFQAYRPALPSLYAGRNAVRFTANNPRGEAKDTQPSDLVVVEYEYRDLPDLPVPQPPARPIHPPDGGRFGFNELFRWPRGTIDGAGVDQYEIYISPRQDLAWPVMPNTHRIIRSAETSFSLLFPDVLRHGATYYWRVRGRSTDGVWGDWSPTWSFVAAGPNAPCELAARFDAQTGQTTLCWQPPRGGTTVDHYEVYASGEPGFSPIRETETCEVSRKVVERRANLLATTRETHFDISDRTEVFYRITAVDADGNRGVPTPIVKLPSPALLPANLPPAVVGKPYSVKPPARLRTGRYALSLRQGLIIDQTDQPTFKLAAPSAAQWLTIDARTGALNGTPPAAGTHTVTVQLDDGCGGQCSRQYVLRIEDQR